MKYKAKPKDPIQLQKFIMAMTKAGSPMNFPMIEDDWIFFDSEFSKGKIISVISNLDGFEDIIVTLEKVVEEDEVIDSNPITISRSEARFISELLIDGQVINGECYVCGAEVEEISDHFSHCDLADSLAALQGKTLLEVKTDKFKKPLKTLLSSLSAEQLKELKNIVYSVDHYCFDMFIDFFEESE